MNKIFAIITSFVFVLLTGTTISASPGSKAIIMNLPDTLIDNAIQKTLPVNFPIQSGTILGSVSIDSIKNLKLQKNKISSKVTLSGHKLNLVTSIAGHDLRMKIGSLTMSFQCDATTRFDKKSQTLFIKPIITELNSSNKTKTEAASALMQLFNNRELPLRLEKLKPIMADTGDKLLNISMRINDIHLQPDIVHLQLIPQITATTKQKNKSQSQ